MNVIWFYSVKSQIDIAAKCQTPSKRRTGGRTDDETRLFLSVRPSVRLLDGV